MSKQSKESKVIENGEKTLLTFLQRTKEGKYSPVDVESIVFTRKTQEYSMIFYPEEEYYYSLT